MALVAATPPLEAPRASLSLATGDGERGARFNQMLETSRAHLHCNVKRVIAEITPASNPNSKSKEQTVNNMSVDPKYHDERCQTAEAYRLHHGLSHG